ncbi:MAG: signal peptidase II, partial [Pseudomonadota bacterium]|nr:signal peptidase II [Pseudomonadota bacterium]
IVLVVAYHLIGIYLNLKKTADNLELLAGGLVQINQNTAPLGKGIGQLNGGLSELLEDFKGALGNLTDRLRFGYVVDFIDFHYQGWHWPAFNLADTVITLGVIVLLIDLTGIFRRR